MNMTKNRIGANGISDLWELRRTNITTLDIQDCKVADPEVLPEIFCKMKELRVLYLKGNPVVKMIPHYRKTVIAHLPNLKYLDDRPVFKDDRRLAEAFVRGGLDAERAERIEIREEKDRDHKRNMDAFNKLIEHSRECARETKAMRKEDKFTDATDPVETWRQKQERFCRENPQYDDEPAGVWTKKYSDTGPEAEAKSAKTKAEDAEKKQAAIAAEAKDRDERLAAEAKDDAEKPPPPPPNWDENIFAPGRKAAPRPQKAAPAKAAASTHNFQPPPRATSAGADNELDELD